MCLHFRDCRSSSSNMELRCQSGPDEVGGSFDILVRWAAGCSPVSGPFYLSAASAAGVQPTKSRHIHRPPTVRLA
jgi:hypothetical protein